MTLLQHLNIEGLKIKGNVTVVPYPICTQNPSPVNWYQSLKLIRGRVPWNELSELIVKRFGEKEVIDEVEEFNKLQQHGSVLEYQEKFESLRTLRLVKNPRLPEGYFFSRFVSGLKEEAYDQTTYSTGSF